jgi:nicotinamide riboside kinase
LIHIAITGPESSGKTTLSRALVQALPSALLVPEFARAYLSATAAGYSPKEVLLMARGQEAWEDWYAAREPHFLVSDTDSTVFEVWVREKYGGNYPQIELWSKKRKADLYLLCAPDFPWQPDPLREHPNTIDRFRLFELFKEELARKDIPFAILGGSLYERVQQALLLIRG